MQEQSTTHSPIHFRTPEQKERRYYLWKNRSPEQQEADRQKTLRANWTPEKIEADRERQRKRRAKMTPEQRAENLRRHREYYYRTRKFKKYGMTNEQWDEMWNEQGKRCKVCGTDKTESRDRWHTDHCHTTGLVRGILCSLCNQMLGMARDSERILRAGADYLKITAQVDHIQQDC